MKTESLWISTAACNVAGSVARSDRAAEWVATEHSDQLRLGSVTNVRSIRGVSFLLAIPQVLVFSQAGSLRHEILRHVFLEQSLANGHRSLEDSNRDRAVDVLRLQVVVLEANQIVASIDSVGDFFQSPAEAPHHLPCLEAVLARERRLLAGT